MLFSWEGITHQSDAPGPERELGKDERLAGLAVRAFLREPVPDGHEMWN